MMLVAVAVTHAGEGACPPRARFPPAPPETTVVVSETVGVVMPRWSIPITDDPVGPVTAARVAVCTALVAPFAGAPLPAVAVVPVLVLPAPNEPVPVVPAIAVSASAADVPEPPAGVPAAAEIVARAAVSAATMLVDVATEGVGVPLSPHATSSGNAHITPSRTIDRREHDRDLILITPSPPVFCLSACSAWG